VKSADNHFSENWLRSLEKRLLKILQKKISKRKDPSHDYYHAYRVLCLAKEIAVKEGADLEIIIPAAIFHDVIVYPKNSSKSVLSAKHSSLLAAQILRSISHYPVNKISKVAQAIKEHSFSLGLKCSSIESKVLHDADKLESSGAICIMRGFSSAGLMNKILLHPTDPFCKFRKPDDLKYALDLYIHRCLKMPQQLYTQTAKKLIKPRHKFLKLFLKQVELELRQFRVW